MARFSGCYERCLDATTGKRETMRTKNLQTQLDKRTANR